MQDHVLQPRVSVLVFLKNADHVIGVSAKPHFLVDPVLKSRNAARGAGCPPGPTLRICIPYQPEGCEPLVPLIVEQPGPLHSLFLALVDVEEQTQRKVLSQDQLPPDFGRRILVLVDDLVRQFLPGSVHHSL